MPELKEKITPVKVTYQCDSCGNGEMKFNGGTLLSLPAQYTHACTNCGHQQSFNKMYPTIEYR